MANPALEIDAIRDYLISVGCKIEYPSLVNAFKQHLYNPDPNVQGKIRTQFKDYVNRLATVCLENNMKFISLRPEFRPKNNVKHKPVPEPQHRQQQQQPPVPPPHHPPEPKQRDQRMPMQEQQPQSQPPPIPPRQQRQRSLSRFSRRKWSIEACSCNYNGLLALLAEDPKLASSKDVMNGYTALHWAAKFGNLDIIKLLAGTHQVSVNIKSSSGQTPLHVAYLFNRLEAANLLLKNYNANSGIRDNNGRRPLQYWRRRDENTANPTNPVLTRRRSFLFK